jgi:hypothetical protein
MSQQKGLVHQQDQYELMELADEEQILAEMAGRALDRYVYHFNQDGQTVRGLSYAGVNWACREYAKRGEVIRIVGKPEIVQDPTDPEYVIVCVTAQRFAIHPETGRETPLDSAVGAKRQWKNMRLRDGRIVPNKFFLESAISKAQRNAKAALFPSQFVAEMIDAALKAPSPGGAPKPSRPAPAGDGEVKGRRQGEPAPSEPSAPPPAPKTSGEGLRMRQRLYIDLQKIVGKDEAKKVLKDIVGVDSSKDASDEAIKALHEQVLKCLEKKLELVQDGGKYRFVEAKKAAPPPSAAVGGEDEPLF